jgi:hypothetical protein
MDQWNLNCACKNHFQNSLMFKSFKKMKIELNELVGKIRNSLKA